MKLIMTFCILLVSFVAAAFSAEESNLAAGPASPVLVDSGLAKTSSAADDLETAENFFLCIGFGCFGGGGGYYGGGGGWGWGWKAPARKGFYLSFNKGGYGGYQRKYRGWGR